MRFVLLALYIGACTESDALPCFDELDHEVVCEDLPDEPELADDDGIEAPDSPATVDTLPGPDDLDGFADDATEVALADDPDVVDEAVGTLAAGAGGRTDIAFGRTKNAERRELLPIGRTPGARRYVIMRLKPVDLPNLAAGDMLRGAAELQVTTACDIGQTGPMCGYTPKIAMQLVLAGDPDATNPHAPGAMALSDIISFSCNADDHHCVKVIDFKHASRALTTANAPGCVADNSCFVNLAVWAYDSRARSGGRDKLIIGANEGNFLQNGDSEQDRGRVMLVRERGIAPADKTLRVTKHDVRGGGIAMYSDGDDHRIYSHTLKGGNDLRAGEKFRVWTEVEATSDHRVNVDLRMFVTKQRYAKHGGTPDAIKPGEISEHNGTNCSPGNPCRLRKVAVFEVTRDIRGPVYINLVSSAEVPGPGVAHVTVHDSGFVKSLRYTH